MFLRGATATPNNMNFISIGNILSCCYIDKHARKIENILLSNRTYRRQKINEQKITLSMSKKNIFESNLSREKFD